MLRPPLSTGAVLRGGTLLPGAVEFPAGAVLPGAVFPAGATLSAQLAKGAETCSSCPRWRKTAIVGSVQTRTEVRASSHPAEALLLEGASRFPPSALDNTSTVVNVSARDDASTFVNDSTREDASLFVKAPTPEDFSKFVNTSTREEASAALMPPPGSGQPMPAADLDTVSDSDDECARLRSLGIPLKSPYIPPPQPPRAPTNAAWNDGIIAPSRDATRIPQNPLGSLGEETHTPQSPVSSAREPPQMPQSPVGSSREAPQSPQPTREGKGTAKLPARVTPGLVARERVKALAAAASGSAREMLSEGRRRRQLERMMQGGERDLAGAAEGGPEKGQWAQWWRKKDPQGLRSRQLTRRIAELKRRRQLPQILALLEEAKARGKAPNRIAMNAAMGACVHCGDVEHALDLFEEMTAPGGCGVDSITYGTLLKGLGAARRLDDAFELLESMEAGTAPGRPELTEVHVNTLVNACADAGDSRRARSVLQRFRAFGSSLAPSVLTYNLLIKGYARSDNPLEALKVVEEMQLQGLPLERVSYNSLILACARGGDLERALDLLQEMKAEAWRQRDAALWPDAVSYTTLLKGLAEDGDLEGVLSLVQEMKAGAKAWVQEIRDSANSLRPQVKEGAKALAQDVEAGNGSLGQDMEAGYGSLGQELEGGVESLAQGMREGAKSSALDMKAGAESLVQEVKVGEAGARGAAATERFLEEAQAVRLLDRVSYGAIIDACLAVGSTTDALKFLREMEDVAKTDPAMRPRSHVFLSLMRAMAARGEWEQVRGLRERFARDGGGRLWPEDVWEADELVLEAAVLSGQTAEAEAQFLAMSCRAPTTTTSSFSHRGLEAVVRLSVASDLPERELQPVLLRPEVPRRSAVEVIMRSVSDTITLGPSCERGDLEAVLAAGQAVVPVLSAANKCIGVLTSEHLTTPGEFFELGSGRLKAASLKAPPEVSRFAPIGDAAALMVSQKAKLLAVVQGNARLQSGLVRRSAGDEHSVVGFVLHETIF